MNQIGDKYGKKTNRRRYDTALSKSWYDKDNKGDKKRIEKVGHNLDNFFKNIVRSPVDERMWTCFKADKEFFSSKRNVSKNNLIALKARGTNDW